MNLYLEQYISKMLKKAKIQYDDELKAWGAYVPGLPGVHAQADSKEELMKELAQVIEEWVYLSLHDHSHIPGFRFPFLTHLNQHIAHA